VYSTVFEVRAAVSPSGGSDNPPDEPTRTAADLPNASITDAIEEADSIIDSYIGGRYVTPVAGDPAPHPIDYWSRNIAAYLATLTQRKGQDFSDNDPVARRYNATMLALTAVRDGKASFPSSIPEIGADGSTGGAEGAAAPFNPNPDVMFGPEIFGLPARTSGGVTVNAADVPLWQRPWPWGV
jgi:phage gp36-like protein